MFSGLIALHIPDGFITPSVAGLGWLLCVLVIWMATRQTRTQFGEAQVPVMGVLAAFIFAAQAINFPIMAGTSGHLVGAALAGIVMGPWAGSLIMAAVVIVQGLIFQDGGLLVMGWNVINMVAAVLVGSSAYLVIFRILGTDRKRSRPLAAMIAAWISVEIGAVATALELAVSGTFPLGLSLPAMTLIYGIVGVCEGVITAAAISLLQVSRPEVLRGGEESQGKISAAWLSSGMALALVIALFSPLASGAPDGLEVVAHQLGASESEPFLSIFPDYSVSFISSSVYSTIVAMVIGVIMVFSSVLAVGHLVARRSEE